MTAQQGDKIIIGVCAKLRCNSRHDREMVATAMLNAGYAVKYEEERFGYVDTFHIVISEGE